MTLTGTQFAPKESALNRASRPASRPTLPGFRNSVVRATAVYLAHSGCSMNA